MSPVKKKILELLDQAITEVCGANETYSAEMFDEAVAEVREKYADEIRALWFKIFGE